MSSLKSIRVFTKTAIFPKQPSLASIAPVKNHVNLYEEYEERIAMQGTEMPRSSTARFNFVLPGRRQAAHAQARGLACETSGVGGKPPSNPRSPPFLHLFVPPSRWLYSVTTKNGAIFTLKSDEGEDAGASVPYLGSIISIAVFLAFVKEKLFANDFGKCFF